MMKKLGVFRKGDKVTVMFTGIVVKGNEAVNYVTVETPDGYWGLPAGDSVTVHFECVGHV